MLSTNDLQARVDELPRTSALVAQEGETEEQTRARRAKARQDRKLAIAIFEGEWQAWLGAEYASTLPRAAQDAVFTLAWEHGHSSGYAEVEGLYAQYATLAETVRAA